MEPWLAKLAEGDAGAAWDLFAARYKPLIIATIKRLVHGPDENMDAFASVCQALAADGCARLRRFSDRPTHTARFSTWLVTVVRNLTVDWLRARDGRHRPTIPTQLSPLQKEIYGAVFVDGRSHLETYELIAARSTAPVPFALFLREVRATYRLAPVRRERSARRPIEIPLPDLAVPPVPDPVLTAESARWLSGALASLPDDVRLAVELFVVEEMSAADVARVVSWPNAKAVYNRVYRALADLRAELRRNGIGPGDL